MSKFIFNAPNLNYIKTLFTNKNINKLVNV